MSEAAGQFVTVGAQEITVWTEVVTTVKVVRSAAAVGPLEEVRPAEVIGPVLSRAGLKVELERDEVAALSTALEETRAVVFWRRKLKWGCRRWLLAAARVAKRPMVRVDSCMVMLLCWM